MVDRPWKIVVGGNGGVGKTTFINYYVNNVFLPDTKMTIGVQFHMKNVDVKVGESIVKKDLILWDLGGQERFRFVLPKYIKGAVAGIVMFDMTRFESLVESDGWFDLMKEHASENAPVLLVGTKWDMMESDDVNLVQTMVEEKVEKRGYDGFAFTSSASGANVEETMELLIGLLTH